MTPKASGPAKSAIATRITKIVKRDGRVVDFYPQKITEAIMKAARAVGGSDTKEAERLTALVVKEIEKNEKVPTVEEVQDAVEKVLIEEGHAKTAKAYILYRAKRAELRQAAAEAAKGGDGEKTALLDMFAHKSKLASIIGYDRIEAYKNLLFALKGMQKSGELPTHPSDYLCANELATSIFQKKYYMKDLNNKLIEKRPEDVFARLAAFMAAVEATPEKQLEWASRFYRALYEGQFMPGGRVLAGGGDLYRLKTLANCFVSVISEDNIESIYQTAYECARTYSYGGGIGVDLSVLRPKGSIVHNAADTSTGSVSFMELFSLTTGLIGQSGRRGALMLTIDIKHPDSPTFINVKKIPNWVTNQIVEQCKWSGLFNERQLREIERQARENTQVRFANISLKVSDEFMQAVDEQNRHGTGRILVYLKDRAVSGLGVTHGGAVHYSYGIPSKPIDKYRLLKACETIEELNRLLTEHGTEAITEKDLTDVSKRDMFGDFVVHDRSTEFDLAIKYAGDFMFYYNSRETGEIKRLVKARTVWNAFVEGNYRTAEPGLIFWSTMTKYSPSNYVGRPIASTNPCVATDSLIATADGLERVDNVQAEQILVDRRAYSSDSSLLTVQYGCELVKPTNRAMTGLKECYRIETKSGYELTATPDHKLLTLYGWKELASISEDDFVLIQSGEGSFNSNPQLPFEVKNEITGKNGRHYKLNLPSAWNRELGMLLGWLIGDGFVQSRYHKAGLVFAKEDEEARRVIQPIFEKFCNRKIKQISYPNGCVQIRSSSKYVIEFLKSLGVKETGEERQVPTTLFTSTEDAVVGFLEGLFSSDGTIGLGSESRNYVRLNSSSLKLLKQVQLLLLNLGVRSTIYDRSTVSKIFRYVNKNGETLKYKTSGRNYELNISKENAVRFISKIVFLQQKNTDKAALLRQFGFYKERFADKVKLKEAVGMREVWDITEPASRSFIANGFVVHNCGEVPLEDGGACNLASVNLSRFVKNGYMKDAKIDWEGFTETIGVAVRFLDNVISWNELLNPLEKQRKASFETRRVGLGVMGIADMLNQLGIGYDSEEGTEMLDEVGKLFANTAYKASANLSEDKAPSPIFEYEAYSKGRFFQEVLTDDTKELIRKKGLRNIALLSIAPTGTISNIVLGYKLGDDNFIGVSGGIEPVFALYYTRRSEGLSGGGSNLFFKIFHSTVDAYLKLNKISDAAQKCQDIDELEKVLPAHFFRTSHFIDPEKRVFVQGLWQKYIDHSISSTVNLPEEIDPETISNIYLDAWKHGLKGITVYREGSRYPILTTGTQQSEFETSKEEACEVEIGGEKKMLRGDEVIELPDGRLTSVYSAKKSGLLKESNGKYKLMATATATEAQPGRKHKETGASDTKLSICPSCKKKTLKIENGCHSCLNTECGFSKCEV